jgi:beta-glucanase (GH16 family)
VGGPPIPGTWTQLVDFNFATMKTLDPRLTPHEWWNNGPTAGEGEEESDPANVVLANGVLNLYARKNNSFGTGWTGALVQTSGVEGDSAIPTFSFLYGYAQATIKVPAGQGLWPAFWMLPESHNDANGELDVMEMLDADTTTVYSTVHRQGVSEQHTIHTTDLSKGFHTFGVDWEPGSETFYIDGKETAVLSNTALISNEPARLILDLAVGGSWGGPPNKSTPSPADMKVSDLQVWQH